MKGGLLLAGIGTLITLIIFAALAPLYNEAVSLVLGNTSNQMAQLLIQLVFPILIMSVIFSILYNMKPRPEAAFR